MANAYSTPILDYPDPVSTRYADTLFRSRLEARWAVFFDALHLRWLYEPYLISLDPAHQSVPGTDPLRYSWITSYRGWHTAPAEYAEWPYAGLATTKYVPDFFLPEKRLWIEIKPPTIAAEAYKKIKLFKHCATVGALGQYALVADTHITTKTYIHLSINGMWAPARWAIQRGVGIVLRGYPSTLKTLDFDAPKLMAAYRAARTYQWNRG